MKFAYQFSNLCGTVYKQANIIFTPDGNCLLSVVGNRVSVFDLVNNTSSTLPYENTHNIQHIALSPDGNLLISIDEVGAGMLVNFHQRIVLARYKFNAKVDALKFSPDGRHFVVTNGQKAQVWRTPALRKEYAPFVLQTTFVGHFDDVSALDWSSDSKFVVTGSRDMSLRVCAMKSITGYYPPTLTGHRSPVIACFFGQDDRTIYSIDSKELIVWRYVPLQGKSENTNGNEERKEKAIDALIEPGKWRFVKRQRLSGRKISSAAYHKANGLLVVGYVTGVYELYDLRQNDADGQPMISQLHSLSISNWPVETIAISPSGEWFAFGVAKVGQLLVWEWQSETYVLKQQGHAQQMTCLAYSPDGQLVATGDEFGKVKVWNMSSGFCFVTFNEHKGAITSLTFSPHGASLFSSSRDGTVRAFDLVRYRNFRTFKSPAPVQFTSVALDWSGEVVCAGSFDPPNIYVWSVQTGRILDELKGHQGPISCLAFAPTTNTLASGSWDKTVRLWDIFSGASSTETLHHSADILALAFRPDGRQLAISTMAGQICLWDPLQGQAEGTIEGRTDLGAGRASSDFQTAKKNAQGKHFTSLCYSGDGLSIIAGGDSKNVVLYDVNQRVVVRKFCVSRNSSLDGLSQFLNSKNMSAAGPLDQIEAEYEIRHATKRERIESTLPGVTKGSHATKSKIRMRTISVRFSPTGRTWATITPEGLVLYSLDERVLFDPFLLEMDITPASVRDTLKGQKYLLALIMSFRLNEQEVISQVIHTIPPEEIQLVIRDLPDLYVSKLLTFLSTSLNSTLHVEFHMLWLLHCFNYHGVYLRNNHTGLASLLRDVQKGLTEHAEALSSICEDNMYSLDYVTSIPRATKAFDNRRNTSEADEPDEDDASRIVDADGDDNAMHDEDDEEDEKEKEVEQQDEQEEEEEEMISLKPSKKQQKKTTKAKSTPPAKTKGKEKMTVGQDDDEEEDSGFMRLEPASTKKKAIEKPSKKRARSKQ